MDVMDVITVKFSDGQTINVDIFFCDASIIRLGN
jgi:hypothetical protein